MPRRLAASLALLVLLAPAGASASRPREGANSPPAAAVRSSRDFEQRLLALVNAERTRRGLPPFQRASCAARAASHWSARLAAAGAVRHQSLRELLRACGARRAAENVASGHATPEALLRAWLGSRRHRAPLLSARFTHVGIGVARSGAGRWYGVADFVAF